MKKVPEIALTNGQIEEKQNTSIISSIKEKIKQAKEKSKNKFQEELLKEKVKLIKETFDREKIYYDQNATTVSEIKKSLKSQNAELAVKLGLSYIENISNELDTTCEKLINGSTNAFTRLLTKNDGVLKSIGETATFSLAARTALSLASPVAGLAVTGALAARSMYKLSKSNKYKKIIDKEYECDKILQKLEITKDEKGNVIDTRFSPNIQENIKNFLQSKKIEFEEFGYQSLREKIYNLKYETKKELVNMLNASLGRGIEVEKRLEKRSNGFIENLRYKSKKIRNAAVGGAAIATAANSIDPAIVSGPLLGTAVGKITSKAINNKLISAATGGVTAIGTEVAQYIPVVGNLIENVEAGVNIATLCAAGAGVGLAGSVATDAIGVIKNLGNRFSTMKNQKKIIEFDNQKYQQDNEKEYMKMQEVIVNRKDSKSEEIIFNLIQQFIEENNIHFSKEPHNFVELKAQIQTLNKQDQKKMTSFLEDLEIYNKNDDKTLKASIEKVSKKISSTVTLGLAGLSVIDILKKGEFLPSMKEKIGSKTLTKEDIPKWSSKPIDEYPRATANEKYPNPLNPVKDQDLTSKIKNPQIAQKNLEKLDEIPLENKPISEVARSTIKNSTQKVEQGTINTIDAGLNDTGTDIKNAFENVSEKFPENKLGNIGKKIFHTLGKGYDKLFKLGDDNKYETSKEDILVTKELNEEKFNELFNKLSTDEKIDLIYLSEQTLKNSNIKPLSQEQENFSNATKEKIGSILGATQTLSTGNPILGLITKNIIKNSNIPDPEQILQYINTNGEHAAANEIMDRIKNDDNLKKEINDKIKELRDMEIQKILESNNKNAIYNLLNSTKTTVLDFLIGNQNKIRDFIALTTGVIEGYDKNIQNEKKKFASMNPNQDNTFYSQNITQEAPKHASSSPLVVSKEIHSSENEETKQEEKDKKINELKDLKEQLEEAKYLYLTEPNKQEVETEEETKKTFSH